MPAQHGKGAPHREQWLRQRYGHAGLVRVDIEDVIAHPLAKPEGVERDGEIAHEGRDPEGIQVERLLRDGCVCSIGEAMLRASSPTRSAGQSSQVHHAADPDQVCIFTGKQCMLDKCYCLSDMMLRSHLPNPDARLLRWGLQPDVGRF